MRVLQRGLSNMSQRGPRSAVFNQAGISSVVPDIDDTIDTRACAMSWPVGLVYFKLASFSGISSFLKISCPEISWGLLGWFELCQQGSTMSGIDKFETSLLWSFVCSTVKYVMPEVQVGSRNIRKGYQKRYFIRVSTFRRRNNLFLLWNKLESTLNWWWWE